MNRSTGADGTESSTLRDEVPWSDSITGYDRQHSTIYLHILDACADKNTPAREIAGRSDHVDKGSARQGRACWRAATRSRRNTGLRRKNSQTQPFDVN
ncbi:MAG: hypothetical protein EOR47_16180 [Mesorhizobium sp.]|nr:MAG: hypothetical protein EOR47_16180 [Mesorhizobium sp.]